MNQSNSTLAKRIADLERQLSNTKNTANTLLEENKQLLIELASVKDLLESSQLCEATAKQYAEEVDKQNAALAAQVEALQKTVVSVKARCNILQNLTLQLIQGAELSGSDWDYISEAQATEIQHHLRQVRADAVTEASGKMGEAFILPASLRRETQKAEFYKAGWRDAFLFIKQYTASIRQEGK